MKKKLWLFWLRKLLRSFFGSANQKQQLQNNKVEIYDETDVDEAGSILERASQLDEIIRLRNQVSDLEDEHVLLREENYRLREQLADLRSRLASFRGGLDDLKMIVDQRKTNRLETVRFREETDRIRARNVLYREETARLQSNRDEEMWVIVIIVVNILSKLITFL